MARLRMSAAPTFKRHVHYSRYRPWLRENFRERSCGYCLVALTADHIDHYEPKEFNAARIDDPLNLILSCAACNGGKLDYHPNHGKRRRRKDANISVLDVRQDDFAHFFSLRADGRFEPKKGTAATYNRAVFNDALMDLNHPDKIRRRAEYAAALSILRQFSARHSTPTNLAIIKAVEFLREVVARFMVLKIAIH